ncbi:MAG: DNA-binding response regulator, partial [candidate division NC10 bacterium]
MITVLLADDHAIVREGLRMILEAQADIRVVGEAADGRQAVRLAR